jgi:hypothetical protein
MSTPRDVNADSVALWCYGIKKFRFDRDRYRITPIMRDGTEGPPMELDRETWEELERRAGGE